jgi:hypothetical protein
MGGRVSDRACRLFARRFGAALVEGAPLTEATAEGRLGAFADGPDLPDRSPDWAFPTVYIAQGVDPDSVLVGDSPGAYGWGIEQRIDDLKLTREPVFCGREEFFEAYYRLFLANEKPVLMISSPRTGAKLGRNRLLQELAKQTMRDGHVPCLVGVTQGPAWDAPKTVTKLAGELLRAIGVTREVFSLGPPLDSLLLQLLDPAKTMTDYAAKEKLWAGQPELLFAAIMDFYSLKFNEDPIGPAELTEVVRADLKTLLTDVKDKHPALKVPSTRVVVFLDRVERYGEKLTTILLSDLLGGTKARGLGTSEEAIPPVPVILSFARDTMTDALNDLIEKKKMVWLEEISLKPFQENGEDLLAYERVLLHPSEKMRGLFKNVSDVAWAFNADADPTVIYLAQNLFRVALKGNPNCLGKVEFYAAAASVLPKVYRDRADAVLPGQYLVRADDEKKMQEFLATQGH